MPRPIIASASVKIDHQRAAAAFEAAYQRVMDLARKPKPGKQIGRHRTTLIELKKLAQRLDQLAVSVQRKQFKNTGSERAEAKRIWLMSTQLFKSLEAAPADEDIENAKESYESSKEEWKLWLRVFEEHMERQTQVTQKITS